MKSFGKFSLSTLLALLLAVLQPATHGSAQGGHDPTVEGSRGPQLTTTWTAPANTVMLQLAFECVKFQGDCERVQILKPPPAQDKPGLHGTAVTPEKALQGDVVKDGVFTVEPGTFVNIKIAYVNDTKTEIRFRAIPHTADPYQLQRLTLLNCVCVGETYRVPPGQGWFHVIRAGAARDVPLGSRIRATHLLTSDGLEGDTRGGIQ